MPRPHCSVYIALSLDGFIARAGGGIDWLSIVERKGEDYGFKRFFDGIDTMVMGRKTYETALGFGTWHDVRLKLAEHRAFESGLVQLTYTIAG